jgi:cytochrome b561
MPDVKPSPAQERPVRPQTQTPPPRATETRNAVYSPAARALHWLTVLMVTTMVPVGLFMTSRAERNIWDGLTNALYSSHKLAGVLLLTLVIVRLAYRFMHGAPPDEPSIEPWQKLASHVTHWTLYALLLVVPILGWIGISLYPALDIFGLFKLPGLVAPNQPASSTVFFLHKLGAFALVALVAVHVGAALFHYFVRKDGVLRRMWPGLSPRDRK